MTQYPALTGKQVVAALQRLGFQVARMRGRHHYVKHPDGRGTVIPVHAGRPSAAPDG
jgi:predicted RNA binding protein YcfA (HicA-like mRNA interferase family)